MIELNLVANTEPEKRILEYLQYNVSETLADKINNGTPFEKDGKPLINKKTLSSFIKYACDEARKLAEKGASSACIDDATVYGWAIHYFEEESIEGTLYTIDGEEYKPVVIKPKTTQKSTYTPTSTAKPKPQNLQFSIFDKIEETDIKDTTNDTSTVESDTNDDESDTPTEEEIQEAMKIVAEEESQQVKPTTVKEQPKGNQTYRDYMLYQSERPTAVVALRLGDFYEVFGDNAVMLGNEIGLTITSRDVGLESRIPMIGFPYHAAENYFAKIVKRHDLYIIENPYDTQFIQCVNYADNRLIDEDTGEILCDDLTEADMRKFDGDIEEPDELFTDNKPTNTLAPNNEIIAKLKAIFGDTFIVR